MAKFEHLKITIPMILSQSVVGMSFVGADVPGFFYNPEPELVIRWYQAATFQPFVRGHGHIDTKRREPWTFDDNVKGLIRSALRTRYSYLPYMYTLFYENNVHGYPINRPLWFHFPQDVNSFSAEESFLLGRDLFVHPIMEKEQSQVNIYFPGSETDKWLDLESNKFFVGGTTHQFPVTISTVPYYQRAGSIIPRRERIRRSAALTLDDPITLDIVLDTNTKKAEGQLYLDDGTTLEYKKNQYLLTSFRYFNGHLVNSVQAGGLKTDVWVERVYIRKIDWKPTVVKLTDKKTQQVTKLQFKIVGDDVLVIRKPGVKVSDEWTITVG
jgi:alpha 1,3-glucosidase